MTRRYVMEPDGSLVDEWGDSPPSLAETWVDRLLDFLVRVVSR